LTAGKRYEPDDPRWEFEQAFAAAIMKDPDLLRASLRSAFVLDPLDEALAVPGMSERVMELGAGWRDESVPAPPREELVAIANG
jgi:hypothetical protein